MVLIDPSRKFMRLEDVRISYRKKDDTIHLTSTDPDVQAGGFHISLNRGTQSEETLRDLLLENGIIGNPGRSQHEGLVSLMPDPASLYDVINGTSHTAKTITVTSARGKSGKTTVAATLAISLAKTSFYGHPAKVCVVDLDALDGGGITKVFAASNDYNAASLALLGRTDKTALAQILRHDKRGVDVLAAPDLGNRTKQRDTVTQYLTPEFYMKTLITLHKMYDYVIFDTSVRYTSPINASAYHNSDLVLYVADGRSGSAYGAERFFGEVAPATKPGFMKPADFGLVVNGTHTADDIAALKRAAPGISDVVCALPIATTPGASWQAALQDSEKDFKSAATNLTEKVLARLHRYDMADPEEIAW